MKILHIDETFHPAYGYQVNPLAKFQQKQGHDVTIMTVDGDHLYPVFKAFGDDGSSVLADDADYTAATGVKIVRIPTKGYIMSRAVYSGVLFKKIRELAPDVIFVHCIETLTGMRFLLKKKEYPLLFDSHMLQMASANRFAKLYERVFRTVFTGIVKKHGYYVIRTQDDDYVNSHLGIPEELTPFISFGTDTLLFKPSAEVRAQFRKDHGIAGDDFVVVYTGKLTKEKGGKLLAEAFQQPLDTERNIVLVVVGTPPSNEYGQEVKAMLEQAAVRVLTFPTQKYTDLAQFYQMGDLSVFPRQCSMSFYDAQACGLPVLSEDNNVNVDRCTHGNGSNFAAEDVDSFRAGIAMYANMPQEQLQKLREAAVAFISEGYNYENIASQYTDYLVKAMQK